MFVKLFIILLVLFYIALAFFNREVKHVRIYDYDEWDFEWEYDGVYGGFEDRVYVDLKGNRITGILKGFYAYSNGDNTQYVYNGKVL